jgi:hypothetical protein
VTGRFFNLLIQNIKKAIFLPLSFYPYIYPYIYPSVTDQTKLSIPAFLLFHVKTAEKIGSAPKGAHNHLLRTDAQNPECCNRLKHLKRGTLAGALA